MTFREQFPDFPQEDFPALPDGFTDTSWRNDACPSISDDHILIWIDRADEARREITGGKRFTVLASDDPYCTVALETDDWSDVLAYIGGRS